MPRVISTVVESRKATPVFSGVLDYFPDAIAAVSTVSVKGSAQHHPGVAMHWDRAASGDEADACVRHLMEAGTRDTDGILHSVKAAWRALALAQKDIELHGHETAQERAAWMREHAGRYPYPEPRVPRAGGGA